MESQNIAVLDDDNDDSDGPGEDIADEVVVKMLKVAPNKLTIDMISLDRLDWDLHVKHGQCRKIDPEHVNDVTLAMYNGLDLGPVDCLLKDRGSMSCTPCLCRTCDMEVSPIFVSHT